MTAVRSVKVHMQYGCADSCAAAPAGMPDCNTGTRTAVYRIGTSDHLLFCRMDASTPAISALSSSAMAWAPCLNIAAAVAMNLAAPRCTQRPWHEGGATTPG